MKTTPSHWLAIAAMTAMASTLVCAPAQADVTTSTSSTPPTGALVRIEPTDTSKTQRWSNSSTTYATIGSHRDLGQTFLIPGASDVSIESFVFRFSTTDKPAAIQRAGFTLSIYQIDSATSMPEGLSPLYQQTGTLPDSISSLDYLTFGLDTPFAATGGGYYAVQLSFNEPVANRSIFFISATKDRYSFGTMYTYSNVAANDTTMTYGIANAQLDFAIIATAIPEQKVSGLLLGAFGVTAAFGFMRRRVTGCR